MPLNVIVIDDDTATLDLMRFQLEANGFQVSTAETGRQGLELFKENHYDVVLTDLNLPDINGIEMVKLCKEASPDTEIIMITGFGSMEKAIEATKAGAFFFVEKPVEFEEVLVLIEKAVERKQQVEEIKSLRGRLIDRTSYFDIIGGSKAMQNIYETIDSVAESDANIFILGESGTGKELIANAIHYKSLRSKKPFVKVNCSALPKELIESELFGHTKGAFTGAAADKVGLIGRASGGSLLLDEIGEMPFELQPKLLRVLQERIYFRLGSEKPQEADFRLISATNRDPLISISEGMLREDLYYRINTIEIRIPPLRERAEDVPSLANHFLKMYAEKYNRPVRGFSQEAHEKMFEHNWPGNVRELQNIIERAVLLSKGETIDESALPFVQRTSDKIARTAVATNTANEDRGDEATAISNVNDGEKHQSDVVSSSAQNVNFSEMSMDEIGKLIVNQLPEPTADAQQDDVFKNLEASVVLAALERTKGNKQAAANLLGLYRPRLYGMIKRRKLDERF